MKKIILIGNIACGKTTICQRLNGIARKYKKTQSIEVIGKTIDTPGEYLECKNLFQALLITAVEAEIVLFVQDACQDDFYFSPGMSAAFPIPVAGIVSKTDIATAKQIEQAKELLALAGANPVFYVSAVTGEGMEELMEFLRMGEMSN